jgi:transcriptional regulator GlxA family with amidase domain
MALLNQSDRTITQIALAVGFGDTGAFTRAFRRHSGETPSQYRDRGRSSPAARPTRT